MLWFSSKTILTISAVSEKCSLGSLDTKRTFHAKLGIIKDTNGMDLREAEDIKKR